MPIKELDKVQLGPSRDGAPESEAEAEVNSDSDQESDVTTEDPDEEREYEVDAIKWARWRDSRKDRTDGQVGWHYGVMWRNYLKTYSDTEEFVQNFVPASPDEPDLVKEFWNALASTNPLYKIKGKAREPGIPPLAQRGKYIEAPRMLLTRWFKAARPKRSYAIYEARRKKELARQPVTKADSDYYWRKKRLAKRAAARAAAGAQVPNPSRLTPSAAAIASATTAPDTLSAAPLILASPVSSLGSVFDSDREVNESLQYNRTSTPDLVVGTVVRRQKRIHSPSPPRVPVAPLQAKAAVSVAKKPKLSNGIAGAPLPTQLGSAPSTSNSNRLAGMKIPKRVEAPQEPERPIHITFGEPDPGIFAPHTSIPNHLPTTQSITLLNSPAAPTLADPLASQSETPIAPLETAIQTPIISRPTSSPPRSIIHSIPPSDPLFLSLPPPEPPLGTERPDVVGAPGGPEALDPPEAPEPMGTLDILEAHTPVGSNTTGIMVDLGPSVTIDALPTADSPHSRLAETLPRAPSDDVTPSTRSIDTKSSLEKEPSLPVPPETTEELHDTIEGHEEASIGREAPQGSETGDLMSRPTTMVEPAATDAGLAAPASIIDHKPVPNLSDRPKYVQGKRIQTLSIPTDDPRLKRMLAATAARDSAVKRSDATRPAAAQWSIAPTAGPSTIPRATIIPPAAPRSWLRQQPTPHHVPHILPPQRPPPGLQSLARGPSFALRSQPSTPVVSNLSPVWEPSPVIATPPYDPARDPRRRFDIAIPTTIMRRRTSGGASPYSNTSNTGNPPGESIADVRISLPIGNDPLEMSRLSMKLLRGSPLASGRPSTLGILLASQKAELVLEEADVFCLEAHLQVGAQILEWTKAGLIATGNPAEARDKDALKTRTLNHRKVFAHYLETPMNGLVDAHHAIIIAHALNVDLESVGLGSWQVEDIGLAFLLVRFPLESASNHSNAVVDPIKPHLSVEAIETKPNAVGSMPLLDSYGIDARFLGNLPGRTVLKCPKPEGLHETLDGALQNAFKACGSEPPEGDAAPDFLIVRNLRLAKTLRLPQLQAAMPRRTKIYAVGSSLHLPLSDWGLRPIWTAGGVVTFSPTFILRSPKAFSEVMKIVRSSETWGAYVLPSVIEWADESWGTQARCPTPTEAFDNLSRALFIDHHLLEISGSAASSGGGLAISCAPPSRHLPAACARWIAWLQSVISQSDYREVTELCRGIRPGHFDRLTEHRKELSAHPARPAPPLELVDLEISQLQDLTAMRLRPHVVPYRRYIYIGETSMDRRSKERYGAGIDFVASEDFAAVFSGSV